MYIYYIHCVYKYTFSLSGYPHEKLRISTHWTEKNQMQELNMKRKKVSGTLKMRQNDVLNWKDSSQSLKMIHFFFV